MSICPVPGCIDQCPLGAYSLDEKKYYEPFCVGHMPKCKCGEIRYTAYRVELKYPLTEKNLAYFSKSCKKCQHVCPIPGCFKTELPSSSLNAQLNKQQYFSRFHYIEHTCLNRFTKCNCVVKWHS